MIENVMLVNVRPMQNVKDLNKCKLHGWGVYKAARPSLVPILIDPFIVPSFAHAH